MYVVTVLFKDSENNTQELIFLRHNHILAQEALAFVKKKIPKEKYMSSIIESIEHFMERDLTHMEECVTIKH